MKTRSRPWLILAAGGAMLLAMFVIPCVAQDRRGSGSDRGSRDRGFGGFGSRDYGSRDYGSRDSGAPGSSSSDKNAVIWERNIFLRDRRTERSRPTTFPTMIRPEQTFMLTGIVEKPDTGGDVLIATFENTRTGFVKVKAGDAIANGHIAQIAYDYLVYEGGGRTARVEVGMNLEGIREQAREAFPTTSPIAGTGAASGAGVGTGVGTGAMSGESLPPPASDIEARLRARRQQELGIKPPSSGTETPSPGNGQ